MAMTLHREAQELASRAALSVLSGERASARSLYSEAADLELRALEAISRDKARTWGIFAVSAAALLYKARRFHDAEVLLHSLLQHRDLAPDIRAQLRDLLDTVWDEQTLPAGFEYSPNEILVSLRGGAIGRGTAPLDVLLSKAGEIRSLMSRAVEWGAQLPFRSRGAPPPDVLATLQARVTQPQAGSYRFSIRLAAPPQMPLFPGLQRIGIQGVTDSLFKVIEAATSGRPNSAVRLQELVPDREYRGAMLKLLRNIVPSGTQLGEVELAQVTKSPRGEPESRIVSLTPGVITQVRDVLRAEASASAEKIEVVELRGVLRAVHLEDDWIGLLTPGGLRKLDGVGELLDDVIGPMVNKAVVVRAQKRTVRGAEKLSVVDVEAEGD